MISVNPHDDPRPELRCVCVSRKQTEYAKYEGVEWPDDYYDRCYRASTAEDNLCDICRNPETTHPKDEYFYYLLTDASTPCFDRTKIDAT